MYHPSRGGVRGGRDQFNWDDVKADKHRENYLGHSLKAPVGRWQKGKDLHWYAKDKKLDLVNSDATKTEIQKIKEEEEQAMREVLGLAPKRGNRPPGNRLDKREAAELFKRGNASEDLTPSYMEGERVQGLGYAPAPRHLSSKRSPLIQSGEPALEEHQRVMAINGREGTSASEPEPRSVSVSSDGFDAKKEKRERKAAKERRREDKKTSKLAKLEKRRHGLDSECDPRRKRGRERHDRHDGEG